MCFDFRDVPSAGFLCFFAACRKGASAVCRDILEAVLEFHLRSSIAFVKHKNVGWQILCLIGGKLCRNEAENQPDRGVLPKGHSPFFQGCSLDIWKTPFFRVFYNRSWFQTSLRAILLQVSPASDPEFLPILIYVCATLLKSPSVHTLIKNKQIKKAKRHRVSFKLNFDEEDFLPRITAPRDNSCYERRIQRYQFFDSTWGVLGRELI